MVINAKKIFKNPLLYLCTLPLVGCNATNSHRMNSKEKLTSSNIAGSTSIPRDVSTFSKVYDPILQPDFITDTKTFKKILYTISLFNHMPNETTLQSVQKAIYNFTTAIDNKRPKPTLVKNYSNKKKTQEKYNKYKNALQFFSSRLFKTLIPAANKAHIHAKEAVAKALSGNRYTTNSCPCSCSSKDTIISKVSDYTGWIIYDAKKSNDFKSSSFVTKKDVYPYIFSNKKDAFGKEIGFAQQASEHADSLLKEIDKAIESRSADWSLYSNQQNARNAVAEQVEKTKLFYKLFMGIADAVCAIKQWEMDLDRAIERLQEANN